MTSEALLPSSLTLLLNVHDLVQHPFGKRTRIYWLKTAHYLASHYPRFCSHFCCSSLIYFFQACVSLANVLQVSKETIGVYGFLCSCVLRQDLVLSSTAKRYFFSFSCFLVQNRCFMLEDQELVDFQICLFVSSYEHLNHNFCEVQFYATSLFRLETLLTFSSSTYRWKSSNFKLCFVTTIDFRFHSEISSDEDCF